MMSPEAPDWPTSLHATPLQPSAHTKLHPPAPGHQTSSISEQVQIEQLECAAETRLSGLPVVNEDGVLLYASGRVSSPAGNERTDGADAPPELLVRLRLPPAPGARRRLLHAGGPEPLAPPASQRHLPPGVRARVPRAGARAAPRPGLRAAALAADHALRQRAVQPRGRPQRQRESGQRRGRRRRQAGPRPQPLRVDEEDGLSEPAQSRQNADKRQIPRGLHGPPARGAREGVLLQPLHHHPPESRAGQQPGPFGAPGQNLVPESESQGTKTSEEARGVLHAQGTPVRPSVRPTVLLPRPSTNAQPFRPHNVIPISVRFERFLGFSRVHEVP